MIWHLIARNGAIPHTSQVDATCEKPTDKEQPLAGLRVLLVEDELDVADLLLFILEEAGAEVVCVTHATAALTRLQNFHPDILISNVKLPKKTGDWLIQRIREMELRTRRHLPAIAITSYTREIAEERMLKAGFERFLPKPLEEAKLISTILDLV